ncbi:MAG: alanine--tRNA ligase [Candidatus Pacebacteria bacterium]|nr:alanine--tRNA ligase [Candidatus Paceibacterota bacterium]
MSSEELRKKFLKFFEERGHKIISSASLIPENDPTTLFTSSGMQPLVPYLMGEPHPLGKRLVDIQKSFRAEDIEEVGDNRHTTFFEMMGNWSLGDYFKKEQLNWLFEFLIEELKLNPQKLYVSVFRGNKEIGIERDLESVEIWKDIFKKNGIEAKDVDFAEKKGIDNGRIFYYDESKNWWSRSGAPNEMPIGEIGGPDSEVFYDFGEELKRHENSKYKNQPCHINCGCGRFVEIGNSVFIEFINTNKGFKPLPQKNVDFGGGLERLVAILQGEKNIFKTDLFIDILKKIEMLSGLKYENNMLPFEVIADHLRAATFIMGDDKGVAPSNVSQGYVVRRLIRRAIRYGQQIEIKQDLWIQEIAQVIIDKYKSVYPELERNAKFIMDNLANEGIKFEKTLEKGLKELEKLFDNYKGNFKNFVLDEKSLFNLYQTYGFPFELSIEEINRKRVQAGGTPMSKETEGNLLKLFREEIKKHQELSRTAAAGKFRGGLLDTSFKTRSLHTACHLLGAALRQVLGEGVRQKGSNITAERLRFDFSYPEKLTNEQIKKVEEIVNEIIKNNLPVSFKEIPLKEAKEEGAIGVFESKYGEKVKVYMIGKEDEWVSKEICGGPHAKSTGELGHFKIIKEESSSAGVRRIKAILE